MTLLAAFTFWQWILSLGIIVVCALLILIILVQQASGGGLVGAFGGGGSGGAFGAKTGDIFTVITVALAAFFLLLTILGNYTFKPVGAAPPAPAATAPSNAPSPDQSVPEPVTPSANNQAATERPDNQAATERPDKQAATEQTDDAESKNDTSATGSPTTPDQP